jgi:Lar family restriction alleviation protein
MGNIKPCPFCGKSNIYLDGPLIIDEVEYYFMVCKDCEAEGPVKTRPLHARYFWNRRA